MYNIMIIHLYKYIIHDNAVSPPICTLIIYFLWLTFVMWNPNTNWNWMITDGIVLEK